jgi:hypothetical protein
MLVATTHQSTTTPQHYKSRSSKNNKKIAGRFAGWRRNSTKSRGKEEKDNWAQHHWHHQAAVLDLELVVRALRMDATLAKNPSKGFIARNTN